MADGLGESRARVAVLVVGEPRAAGNMGRPETDCASRCPCSFERSVLTHVLTEDNERDCAVDMFFCSGRINRSVVHAAFGHRVKSITETACGPPDAPERWGVDISRLAEQLTGYYEARARGPAKFPLCVGGAAGHWCPGRAAETIKRFYKRWRAYKAMCNYEAETGISYDYILLLRPDCHFAAPMRLGEMAPGTHALLAVRDWLYFGERAIMEHLCLIVFSYGRGNFGEKMREGVDRLFADYYAYKQIGEVRPDQVTLPVGPWIGWSESPEVFQTEHILDYCDEHGVDIRRIAAYCAWDRSPPPSNAVAARLLGDMRIGACYPKTYPCRVSGGHVNMADLPASECADGADTGGRQQ